MARKKIKWKECLSQGAIGSAMGFSAGGGIALGIGIIMALSPRTAGMRKTFILKEM